MTSFKLYSKHQTVNISYPKSYTSENIANCVSAEIRRRNAKPFMIDQHIQTSELLEHN